MQGVIVRIAVSVFGLLTLAMVLLAVYNEKGAFAVHAQSLKVQAVRKEIKALENENKNLSEEIKALENADPAVIEKIARDELGLVKPGDRILVLPADPASDKN
jgi:cell division protein FtsB